jgi:ATP-dependent DNA helicase RecG
VNDKQQLSFDLGKRPIPIQAMTPHDLFSHADEKLLDRLVENSGVEKKSGKYGKMQLCDYFSMWANTSPDGGLILVGVENDGRKSGLMQLSEKQIADLELCGPHLCPDAKFDQKKINILNDAGQSDFVLLFYIRYNPTRVVETHKGRAFIRRGNEKHELDELEKSELRIDKGEIDFEDEYCGLLYPEQFDLDAVAAFANAVREQLATREKRSDEEILVLKRLGTTVRGRFRANNACALLFSDDPQSKFAGCKLRFTKFDGNIEGVGAKRNAVKDIWIEGTISRIIADASSTMKSQVREFQRLGPDGKFFGGPEYPEEAWYEAIVNACVHRSYNMRNIHINIKMFDDRLEIESPGGFPPGITPENIYTHSVPRNRRLAEAMFYLKYVLIANEGTRRMRELMRQFGLPEPEFRQAELDGLRVRVTLKNNYALRKEYVDKRAIDTIGHRLFSTLNEKERVLVNYTAEHSQITVADASRIVRGGWKQSKKTLASLVARGILTRVSPLGRSNDPKAHYIMRKAKSEKGKG